jgi:hypothetical protein
MAFFQSFTNSIKEKWLQFFQVNRDWITLQMTAESVYTPDGGKRPSSYLILGVVNALEPKLAQLMYPFAKLNSDADTLVEVLDLNFDPDIALGNRLSPTTEPAVYAQELNELAAEEEISIEEPPTINTDLNGFGEESHGDTDDNSLLMDGLEEIADDFLPNSFSTDLESVETPESSTLDDFSFDTVTLTGELEENLLDDLNTPDEGAFRDVLSDVWGDENSLGKGEESGGLLGEELPSEVFDDSEIARLFPNS